MRNAHEVADVRAAESALMARVPDGKLMQRAAAGLASACAGLLRQVYGSRIVVLAGTGDNGGDALYAGALLARRGAVVTAISTGPKAHPGGSAALRGAGGRVTDAAADGAADLIGGADLIIDGMLGIGGRGGLREPGASLAVRAGAASGLVVAVDLPSGIDADTGEVPGAAVRADATVTFGTWKPGLLIDPGAMHAGAAELIDIGLGPCLAPASVAALQASDVAALLPRPTAESDKYRRGVLGILAGSSRFTGAAMLAVGGAVRGGAGMIRLVTAEHAASVVRQHWPEAVITVVGGEVPAGRAVAEAGQVQAWVAGPGFGTEPSAAVQLADVMSTSLPVLVDADGITVLAAHPELLPRSAPTLITPHAGELARLLRCDRAAVEARRLEHARGAAAELGVTVLLKGSTTVIAAASGNRPVLVNATGTGWLATAGSGDVLSGLAGSLLAQGLAPADAAAVGAYLHGMAARLAATGVAAQEAAGAGRAVAASRSLAAGAPIGAADLIDALPAAIRMAAARAG
jgi:ADP-dependent NAD(P)H-hydrate dehydratase / NAD(P)H-hydrate epimerase